MDRTIYFKTVASVAIIILGVYLVYPVIPGLIGGFVLSYSFFPVYIRIYNKTKIKTISAGITTLFISAPVIAALIYTFYNALSELDLVIDILETHSFISILTLFGIDITGSPLYEFVLETFPQIVNLTVTFSGIMNQVPLTLLNMTILFLSLFYFLSEKESIEDFVTKIIPSSYQKDLIEILKPTKDVIDGLIYGNVVNAMATGFLAIIGFTVLGVPYSFLLGLLVALASLLPIIGPWAVFIPLGAYYLALGNYFRGFALLIYGILVLEILYNRYIQCKFYQKQPQLHPFILLIGLFGGLYMLGPIGIIYGPIIIGLLKGVGEGMIKEATQKKRFFRL
jgi:predicted PurR-regulated permease PerM